MASPRAFADLLSQVVGSAPSAPLVTFYDLGSGERTELSVATYANWVAKTAGLLGDELELSRGDAVLLDLPTHWLVPVWLGAAWSAGLVVHTPPTDITPALIVCGPATLDQHAPAAKGPGAPVPLVAMALQPMAGRFTDPPPHGVIDFGIVVWGQPDAFYCSDPPGASDAAAWLEDRCWSQADLLAAAALGPRTRQLVEDHPASAAGVRALLGGLAAGSGTVWVDGTGDLDRTQLDRRLHEIARSERAEYQPRS